MAIAAACSECQAKLKLPDASFLKKRLKCPKCGEAMTPRAVKASAGGTKRPPAKRRPAADDDPFGGLDDLLEQDRRNPAAVLPPVAAAAAGKAKKRPPKKSASGGANVVPILGGIAGLAVVGFGLYLAVQAMSGGALGPGGETAAMAWLPANSKMVATLRPPMLVGDSMPADARRQLDEALADIRDELGADDFTLEDVGFAAVGMESDRPQEIVATVVSEKLLTNLRRPQKDLERKTFSGFTVWEAKGGPDEMSIALVADDVMMLTAKSAMEETLAGGPPSATFQVDRSLPASVWVDVQSLISQAGQPVPQGDDLPSRAMRELGNVRLDVASVDYPIRLDVAADFTNAQTAEEVASFVTGMGPVVLGRMGLLERPGQMPDWLNISASGDQMRLDLDIPEEVGRKLADAAAQQASQFAGGFGPPGGGFGPPGEIGRPPGFGPGAGGGFGPPGGSGSPPEGFTPPEGFGGPPEGFAMPPGGRDGSPDAEGEPAAGGGFFDE